MGWGCTLSTCIFWGPDEIGQKCGGGSVIIWRAKCAKLVHSPFSNVYDTFPLMDKGDSKCSFDIFSKFVSSEMLFRSSCRFSVGAEYKDYCYPWFTITVSLCLIIFFIFGSYSSQSFRGGKVTYPAQPTAPHPPQTLDFFQVSFGFLWSFLPKVCYKKK